VTGEAALRLVAVNLLGGPAEAFHVVDDPGANLASWFHPHPAATSGGQSR